jgi:hypothetical protein
VISKDAAFREFHRVLREGGRLSIFEPINRYFADGPGSYWGFEVTPIVDLVQKLETTYHTSDPGHPGPMMDFDERDLFKMAERAGFSSVGLDLEVRSERAGPRCSVSRGTRWTRRSRSRWSKCSRPTNAHASSVTCARRSTAVQASRGGLSPTFTR